MLKQLFHLLPDSAKRILRQSDDALSTHLWERSRPLDGWYDEYLTFLLHSKGTCHFISNREAATSWETDGAFPRRLTAYTRLRGSSDLPVLRQVWEEREYHTVAEYMANYVSYADPLRIIDAGANAGYATLFFKSAFPNAEIVCLEPDSGNFNQIKRNVAINKLTNVTPIQAGLWKTEAYLEVGRDVGDQMEWSFYVKEVPGPSDLRGYSVAHLAQERGWPTIDLLKIDIEGGERYLFETPELARKLLENTRFVAIEIHDIYQIRPHIYELLRQNGIDFFEHGELTIGRNMRLVPETATLLK